MQRTLILSMLCLGIKFVVVIKEAALGYSVNKCNYTFVYI